MYKQITYLKDSIGQQFVGVKFTKEQIEDILTLWKSSFNISLSLENDKLLNFIKNRENRDGLYYHITLINSMEWMNIKSKLSMVDLQDLIFTKLIVDIQFMGIGKAVKGDNEAHFIVVNSISLNEIREKLNLEKKDLHITLGFDRKDVHGISKGLETIYIDI